MENLSRGFQKQNRKKKHMKGLSFITQFKIEFVLTFTGCRKVLGKMPASSLFSLFSTWHFYLLYTNYLTVTEKMVVKSPYKIRNKKVAYNHHAAQCDKRHLWVHIKCNRINLRTYKYRQKWSYIWYFPVFWTCSNEELYQTNQGH